MTKNKYERPISMPDSDAGQVTSLWGLKSRRAFRKERPDAEFEDPGSYLYKGSQGPTGYNNSYDSEYQGPLQNNFILLNK